MGNLDRYRLARSWIGAASAVCLMAASAGVGAQGVGAQGADAQSVDAQAAETPAQRLTTSEYRIGPGDMINVFVRRQPELSVTIPVRPDGRVTTPLIEDIVAVGKTPTELAREMETLLAEYIRTPEVTVMVQGFVGVTEAQITVLGQVRQPGSVPYREGTTLLTAVLAAGGLTEFAAGNRARLRREGRDGEMEEYRVRLDDLVTEGKIEENRDLLPGDVIVVPEAFF